MKQCDVTVYRHPLAQLPLQPTLPVLQLQLSSAETQRRPDAQLVPTHLQLLRFKL